MQISWHFSAKCDFGCKIVPKGLWMSSNLIGWRLVLIDIRLLNFFQNFSKSQMKKKIPVKKRERKLVIPDSKPILKDLRVNVQKLEISKLTSLKAYPTKRVGRPAMKKAIRSIFSRDQNIESQPILSIMKIRRNGNFLRKKSKFLYNVSNNHIIEFRKKGVSFRDRYGRQKRCKPLFMILDSSVD